MPCAVAQVFLVFGARGWIGSLVMEHLKANGYKAEAASARLEEPCQHLVRDRAGKSSAKRKRDVLDGMPPCLFRHSPHSQIDQLADSGPIMCYMVAAGEANPGDERSRA